MTKELGPGTPFVIEDGDLAAAAVWSGVMGVYDPRPVVYHHHGRKTKQDADQLWRYYGAGRAAYFAKYILRKDTRDAHFKEWSQNFRRDCLEAIRRGQLPKTPLRDVYDGNPICPWTINGRRRNLPRQSRRGIGSPVHSGPRRMLRNRLSASARPARTGPSHHRYRSQVADQAPIPPRLHRRNLVIHPLVSVVTPFFNTAPYLAECIESVLAQTHSEFEYILMDNCSTDGSYEIAESYAARDPRIRLLRCSEFVSQLKNYNRALREICEKSQYCKIVQADDYIFPNCLQSMLKVFEQSEVDWTGLFIPANRGCSRRLWLSLSNSDLFWKRMRSMVSSNRYLRLWFPNYRYV